MKFSKSKLTVCWSCFYVACSAAVIFIAIVWAGLRVKQNDTNVLPNLTPKTFGLPLTNDTKVMVLLSGWPDTHKVWQKQIEEFQDTYHMVSIPNPDHDTPTLRREWGYTLNEVPTMIVTCVEKYLGTNRKIDVLMTHDWGSLYGYYALEVWAGSGTRKVERLVAIDIGSSEYDTAELSANIPGVTSSTLFSVPYQIYLASLFAIGSGVSSSLAEYITTHSWPLMPLLTPMESSFDWNIEAVRPQEEVKWWYGYTYFYLWAGRLGLGPPVPQPLFPKAPCLFVFGKKKRTMFHSQAFVDRLNSTPGSLALEYPESSHWLMYTHSRQFNRDLLAFTKEV
jgi:pimeloyl-ACP methyl ester carboxylesterase